MISSSADLSPGRRPPFGCGLLVNLHPDGSSAAGFADPVVEISSGVDITHHLVFGPPGWEERAVLTGNIRTTLFDSPEGLWSNA